MSRHLRPAARGTETPDAGYPHGVRVRVGGQGDSLTYGDVFAALERAARAVGRKVNPTVYTPAEFSKRVRAENAFVTRVLEQPKVWIIGSEHDLPVAA